MIIRWLLMGFNLWAYPCPQSVVMDSELMEAQAWLSTFQGQKTVGECQIEITVCTPGESGWKQSPLAEILVIDKDGREAYLPLSVPDTQTSEIKTSITMGKRYFKYVRRDRFKEKDLGRTETYQLEFIRNSQDDTMLKSIDLSTYSTNHKLNQPNGNQSRWYNCGE